MNKMSIILKIAIQGKFHEILICDKSRMIQMIQLALLKMTSTIFFQWAYINVFHIFVDCIWYELFTLIFNQLIEMNEIMGNNFLLDYSSKCIV